MLNQFIATLILCIKYASSHNCLAEGIHSYAKKAYGDKMRHTTIHNGNYTIQALLTFTNGKNCDQVSKEGVVKAFALKSAIDNINKLLTPYNTKLGLQMDDVCRNLPMTIARGIEIAYFHRPKSKCRSDHLMCDRESSIDYDHLKHATAVIGSELSFTTVPLASLTSFYNITHMSYGSSNRLLSDKEFYRSFFRTIPSDTNQVLAMVDMFKQFNWNYIFAIGSDDDYGKLAIEDLKREANKSNICLSNEEFIPFQSTKTKDRVEEVIKQIKTSKATAVVLFCYLDGLGQYILEEAQKQGLHRIWITSEDWTPGAISLDHSLRNQTEGLLSISVKSHNMDPFIEYMENEIKNHWECNMWLKKYIESKFDCLITTFTENVFYGKYKNESCHVAFIEISDNLSILPGKIQSLIDSTTAVGTAILEIIKEKCDDYNCTIAEIPQHTLLNKMYNISFKNDHGNLVSFDSNGDPSTVSYTLENLQFIGDEPTFVEVGEYKLQDDGQTYFKIDQNKIKWPKDKKGKTSSTSNCHRECEKGEAVIKQRGCCWECIKCSNNFYTDKKMSPSCKHCGRYSYTKDHKNCLKRSVLWLDIANPAGMSIIIVTLIGMVTLIAACIASYKLHDILLIKEPTPNSLPMACAVVAVTLVYLPLHILEPTQSLCKARSAFFFLLLVIYCTVLLIHSRFMTTNLQSYADSYLKGNLLATQVIFLFVFIVMEVSSIAAWLHIDKIQVKEFPQILKPHDSEIRKQCDVSFTAARLVSTFIPCMVLVIALFVTYRERNLDHSFYEPKFISFSCIAVCIIIIAFLPTFKYVVDIYKAIVLALTISVFGVTFIGCLVLPKVYVAVMRNRGGLELYPMKPGFVKKKSEKDIVAEIRAKKPEDTTPAKTPVKKPIKTPIKKPIKESVKKPIKKLIKTHIKMPIKTPMVETAVSSIPTAKASTSLPKKSNPRVIIVHTKCKCTSTAHQTTNVHQTATVHQTVAVHQSATVHDTAIVHKTAKEEEENVKNEVPTNNVYNTDILEFHGNFYENGSFEDDFNMGKYMPPLHGSYCGIKNNSVDRTTKL